MTSTKKPVVFIACQVLQNMIEQFVPPELADRIHFFDYGLHRVPSKLAFTLQDALDSIAEPSLVVLGYGLCGNGLNGLKAGVHALLMPRVDDCIAILLGSREAYRREFNAVPGTYYLSKGWLESGSHPLKEYHEIREKYGPEDAAWIMDQQYQHYERLMLVAHSPEDMAQYRLEAQQVADYCGQWGMRYEERLGSTAFVERLVAAALHPDELDDDFLLIPPGGEIRQEQFM